MIDKQAIETMTQMLALISKFSKSAYPKVTTEASSENRRRAWVFTKMLARLAEHAAESDFYFHLSDNVNTTNAERLRCYQIARQEDCGFMDELHKFKKRAKEFESKPATGKDRTDNDIVRELERLLQQVQVAQGGLTSSSEPVGAKLTKKQRELNEANRSVVAERLAIYKRQLESTEKLALSRGMVVSQNRHRTVIKRVDPAPTQNIKPAPRVSKAKTAPVLKLVSAKAAPQSETKTSRAKKYE